MSGYESTGKLPGKTEFSGRRRSTTRESGFHVHPDTTGGEFKYGAGDVYRVPANSEVTIEFAIPSGEPNQFVGYGAWYRAPENASVSVIGENASPKYTATAPAAPNWSKVGSMWVSNGKPSRVEVTLSIPNASDVSLFEAACGSIEHPHLADARAELLRNMYQFSPEANFYSVSGEVTVWLPEAATKVSESPAAPIPLKSCNRCGRFLPINLSDEQKHLSFSNHCKAAHRVPCKHPLFGKLRDVETGKPVQLEYGFQLECRFCKKFEVNAAHNPQRTAAQMKEDGARRRFFELLLMELYGESPQLRYRHQTGGELADDVWERFGRACFACGSVLESPRAMNLDHTRPLALLWPLDGTATALCANCNSAKRDRPPAQFYDSVKLAQLARITGIPLSELKNPTPNLEAIRLLKKRLDWFFNEFLSRPEMTKERDGKIAGELVVKALEKVLSAAPPAERFSIQAEFERRRRR